MWKSQLYVFAGFFQHFIVKHFDNVPYINVIIKKSLLLQCQFFVSSEMRIDFFCGGIKYFLQLHALMMREVAINFKSIYCFLQLSTREICAIGEAEWSFLVLISQSSDSGADSILCLRDVLTPGAPVRCKIKTRDEN